MKRAILCLVICVLGCKAKLKPEQATDLTCPAGYNACIWEEGKMRGVPNCPDGSYHTGPGDDCVKPTVKLKHEKIGDTDTAFGYGAMPRYLNTSTPPTPTFTPVEGKLCILACCPKGWWPHVPPQKDSSDAAYVNARLSTKCSREIPDDAASGIYTRSGKVITREMLPLSWRKKHPEKIIEVQEPFIYSDGSSFIGTTSIWSNVDEHGCDRVFLWNEEKKECYVDSTYGDVSHIDRCELLKEGKVTRCWYKPVVPAVKENKVEEQYVFSGGQDR